MVLSLSSVSPHNTHWTMPSATEISNTQQGLEVISSGFGLADSCIADQTLGFLVLETPGR